VEPIRISGISAGNDRGWVSREVVMRGHLIPILIAVFLLGSALQAQVSPSEQIQVGPPPMRRAEPPSAEASAADLEKRGDELRADKAYLDAIDYYRAALGKKKNDFVLLNKVGITNLLLQNNKEAAKDFEKSIKANRNYAEAYNNLGVVRYEQKKYKKAIKLYEKAIKLRNDAASYYSNLGAAYFARKKWEQANNAYARALALDPDIFERSSRAGVAAQLSSPADRAHFDFVMARLYAKSGDLDRSLLCLRRSMEEGYKNIEDVFTDSEFAGLRKDPRFAQLMADRPVAIPE
jgi:tetratricopeptide (TPR) repeat protein